MSLKGKKIRSHKFNDAIQALFDFPLSYYNIVDLCSADLCPCLERKALRASINGHKIGVDHVIKNVRRMWTMDMKVEYVIDNITGLTGKTIN